MCYCDCYAGHCETSALGYKWNGGILKEDGSYALNGTKGDGKEYSCSLEFNPNGIIFIKNMN
jgi:hypothetical protein